MTVCLGKSTYARCGIIVNVTPFEPEWEGTVTLEISKATTPLPAKIYANEGLAQVLFFQGDEPCEVSCADKKGKYPQADRRHPALPKVSSDFPDFPIHTSWRSPNTFGAGRCSTISNSRSKSFHANAGGWYLAT